MLDDAFYRRIKTAVIQLVVLLVSWEILLIVSLFLDPGMAQRYTNVSTFVVLFCLVSLLFKMLPTIKVLGKDLLI